jgi:hypothetical protein
MIILIIFPVQIAFPPPLEKVSVGIYLNIGTMLPPCPKAPHRMQIVLPTELERM